MSQAVLSTPKSPHSIPSAPTSRSEHSILTILIMFSLVSSSLVGPPLLSITKSPSPTGPRTEYFGSAAGRNGSRMSGLTVSLGGSCCCCCGLDSGDEDMNSCCVVLSHRVCSLDGGATKALLTTMSWVTMIDTNTTIKGDDFLTNIFPIITDILVGKNVINHSSSKQKNRMMSIARPRATPYDTYVSGVGRTGGGGRWDLDKWEACPPSTVDRPPTANRQAPKDPKCEVYASASGFCVHFLPVHQYWWTTVLP